MIIVKIKTIIITINKHLKLVEYWEIMSLFQNHLTRVEDPDPFNSNNFTQIIFHRPRVYTEDNHGSKMYKNRKEEKNRPRVHKEENNNNNNNHGSNDAV